MLGLVFIATWVILWLPWMIETWRNPSSPYGLKSVIERIFPTHRGLFQDKVASFWCVLHNFIKLDRLFPQHQLVLITTIVTLIASAPACVNLYTRPTPRNFILAQFAVSMSFLLFSFHVHEKQILCPLIFFGLAFPELKHFFSVFVLVSNFSMLRLYTIEKNILTYRALTIGYQYLAKQIEGIALKGFKLSHTAKVAGQDEGENIQRKSGIVIYNESYKLNISE